MAKPRMIQGQFGTIQYQSGVLDPNVGTPLNPTVAYLTGAGNSYLGVTRRNDEFYIPDKVGAPTEPLQSGIHFATFDYVDLRDLLEEKACMDDVTINIQRLREVPFPNFTYNMAPGNIEETLIIVLGNAELETVNTTALQRMHYAGFGPMPGTAPERNIGGLPFEVLYRENRQYTQDPSTTFNSPDQMGSQAGPLGNAANAPTRFVNNLRLQSRTIGGYPDLIVGPGITIIRMISVWPAVRTSQSLDGGGPSDAPAEEYTFLQSQVQCTFPALQYNIVGTQRPLTATETATYYSNIMLNG